MLKFRPILTHKTHNLSLIRKFKHKQINKITNKIKKYKRLMMIAHYLRKTNKKYPLHNSISPSNNKNNNKHRHRHKRYIKALRVYNKGLNRNKNKKNMSKWTSLF
jgi:hypothetical protein